MTSRATPAHLSRHLVVNQRREHYIRKFKLNYSPIHIRRRLPSSLLDQLDRCANDAARRLLLGVRR